MGICSTDPSRSGRGLGEKSDQLPSGGGTGRGSSDWNGSFGFPGTHLTPRHLKLYGVISPLCLPPLLFYRILALVSEVFTIVLSFFIPIFLETGTQLPAAASLNQEGGSVT